MREADANTAIAATAIERRTDPRSAFMRYGRYRTPSRSTSGDETAAGYLQTGAGNVVSLPVVRSATATGARAGIIGTNATDGLSR